MTVLNELDLQCVVENCLNEETTQESIEIRNDEWYAVIRIVQPLYHLIYVENYPMCLLNQEGIITLSWKAIFASKRWRITVFENLRHIELMEY